MLLNKKFVKQKLDMICYEIGCAATRIGAPSLTVTRRYNHVAVALKEANVEFSVTMYGEGYNNLKDVVPTFRISTNCALLLYGKYRGDKDTFFREVWKTRQIKPSMEVSFLFEETVEVVEWILDSLPVIKKPFPFPSQFSCNAQIGEAPAYIWTKDAWDTMERKNKEKKRIKGTAHEARI